MRFWCSLLFLSPVLVAQPQVPEAPVQPAPHNYWHFQPPPARKFFAGNLTPKPLVIPPNTLHATAAPKTCSLPLINIHKDKLSGKYHMKKIPRDPAADEHFRMTTVTPPAPPCDDGRR